MKVVVAGATGAIGRPLIGALQRSGHLVYALVRSGRSAELARSLGATPVLADVLDREKLLRAADGLTADAVVHELTAYRNSPPTHYRSRGLARTNELRTTGSRHLVDFAAAVGATRYLTQSLVLGYGLRDHGAEPLTELTPFGRPQGERIDASIEALNTAENSAVHAPGLAGIALRYGIFYGPGASDPFLRPLRRRIMPLPRGETGYIGFIHIEDAAAATVAALDHGRAGQAYNIVDDEPVTWSTHFDALARTLGAPPPRRVPARVFRLAAPLAAAQMLDMSMRVANTKAATELHWQPAMPTMTEGLQTLT
ncbi:NAD-dependent epimerase/dehydratase family protein [Nocardia otitidiscaviarum]|uniref:NAD-dependent epimerase/dehydratase family protein n=1 Tax=Nocardia otitidiscaviarum TaxID=1823 RepID=UPI0024579AEC|nr:NAD(P)-dependent oxidoreductase [Nocardia otitidiscaviarum]